MRKSKDCTWRLLRSGLRDADSNVKRPNFRKDAHTAAGLGNAHRSHREGDDRRAVAREDFAGACEAVRLAHALHSRNNDSEGNDRSNTPVSLIGRPRADILGLWQTLTFKLMPKVDDSLKADVVKWSAFYEHRIRNGSVRTWPSNFA